MYDYTDPDTLLALGKAKMKEFHRECEDMALAKEAQRHQPGRTTATLNQAFSLFQILLLKGEKRFALRKKTAATAPTNRAATDQL